MAARLFVVEPQTLELCVVGEGVILLSGSLGW